MVLRLRHPIIVRLCKSPFSLFPIIRVYKRIYNSRTLDVVMLLSKSKVENSNKGFKSPSISTTAPNLRNTERVAHILQTILAFFVKPLRKFGFRDYRTASSGLPRVHFESTVGILQEVSLPLLHSSRSFAIQPKW